MTAVGFKPRRGQLWPRRARDGVFYGEPMDTIVAMGPRLYWPLRSYKGLEDWGVEGDDASITGGAGTIVPGNPRAIFDGSGRLDASSYDPFASGVFSFAAWVKITDLANIRALCANTGSPAPWLLVTTGGNIQWRPDGTTTGHGNWSLAAPLTVGTLYHIALAFDEPGDLARLWIDSVSEGNRVVTAPFSASGNAVVGGRGGTGGNRMVGEMGHPAFFDRYFTNDDVNTLYAAGPGA